jgi:hypothetical protein
LAQFNQKIAKLVEFTREKQKIPKYFQVEGYFGNAKAILPMTLISS